MSETCTVRYLPPEEVEAMLTSKFGSALKPVDHETKKRMNTFVEPTVPAMSLRPKEKKFQEPRMILTMQPHDLTARRIRELIEEGKSSHDVMKMYDFKNRGYFTQTLHELGCHDLVAGPGKKKVW